jgi:hypothetical protein
MHEALPLEFWWLWQFRSADADMDGPLSCILSLDSFYSNPIYNEILKTPALISFVMWIWMISDYFKRNNLKHKSLWGWLLVLFNLVAGLIYFMFVYFPNERMRLRQSENVG